MACRARAFRRRRSGSSSAPIRSAGSESCRKRRRSATSSTPGTSAASRSPRCAIAMLSRYYIQCGLDTEIADWPDDRFWEELKRRFPDDIAAQDRHRPVDREVDRPLAQLRRRADALRPAVSRRRRRPYRPADRGEGPEPRDLRRLLSPARPGRPFRQGRRPLSRTAIRTWRCGGSGRPSAFPGG